jgi:hypothetical protein
MTLKGSAQHSTTMPTTLETACAVDKSIYNRTRILNVLYKKDVTKFGSLLPADIVNITLTPDKVQCLVEGSIILVDRSDVVKNFWEHRTRTPSFFDYKIWNAYNNPAMPNSIPIGALDYGAGSIASALETHLGRVPTIASDKNGTKKLYYVNENSLTCTCHSWQQLSDNREEFEAEFDKYSTVKFEPVCKHVQWLRASIRLQSLAFAAKQREHGYNSKLCVYYFDHRHGVLRYRVTHDGVKDKGQWLPVDDWKEKPVYDGSYMPTGLCWQTFEGALSQQQPFKLLPYSHSVAALMNRNSRK